MIPEVNEGTIDFNQPKKLSILDQYEVDMISKNIITFSNAVMYRNYKIYHNTDGWRWSGQIFQFEHDSFDGPGDHRLGWGNTLEECIKNINEQIEELAS